MKEQTANRGGPVEPGMSLVLDAARARKRSDDFFFQVEGPGTKLQRRRSQAYLDSEYNRLQDRIRLRNARSTAMGEDEKQYRADMKERFGSLPLVGRNSEIVRWIREVAIPATRSEGERKEAADVAEWLGSAADEYRLPPAPQAYEGKDAEARHRRLSKTVELLRSLGTNREAASDTSRVYSFMAHENIPRGLKFFEYPFDDPDTEDYKAREAFMREYGKASLDAPGAPMNVAAPDVPSEEAAVTRDKGGYTVPDWYLEQWLQGKRGADIKAPDPYADQRFYAPASAAREAGEEAEEAETRGWAGPRPPAGPPAGLPADPRSKTGSWWSWRGLWADQQPKDNTGKKHVRGDYLIDKVFKPAYGDEWEAVVASAAAGRGYIDRYTDHAPDLARIPLTVPAGLWSDAMHPQEARDETLRWRAAITYPGSMYNAGFFHEVVPGRPGAIYTTASEDGGFTNDGTVYTEGNDLMTAVGGRHEVRHVLAPVLRNPDEAKKIDEGPGGSGDNRDPEKDYHWGDPAEFASAFAGLKQAIAKKSREEGDMLVIDNAEDFDKAMKRFFPEFVTVEPGYATEPVEPPDIAAKRKFARSAVAETRRLFNQDGTPRAWD
ncbi:MAG: hypothetical protein HUJ63_03180, partial [Enterococcus sp.]|nr:hypothetical protein [Enterococcus sp.]